ncbi:MAG: SDR family oxidoreductase [Solirubrobacterales bacterium]|nr:SDR family oxidoreductase [Solirubrobacterales bacterium]
MDLRGRVVLITGGARGIGAAVGAESGRRGARVALAGLEPDLLAETADRIGGGTHHVECDVTDMKSVEDAVASTVERFGGIDVVLANAGIGTYGTAEKGDPGAWLRTVDVNLSGVYRTLHATLPHVIERRGYIGVVCSIASFAPLAGMSSYNASKAGAEALVRAVRQEVGFRGVDVGAIHPSWIDTDMVRESELDLPSFRAARAKLPWPVRATTSVEACARAIVEGFEQRRARVFVPRTAVLTYWLRTLITSAAGERITGAESAVRVPQMEREIAALGRSGSERTSAINELADASDVAEDAEVGGE